jgi:hypothetical protein
MIVSSLGAVGPAGVWDLARIPCVDIEPLFGMILAQGKNGLRDSTPDPT